MVANSGAAGTAGWFFSQASNVVSNQPPNLAYSKGVGSLVTAHHSGFTCRYFRGKKSELLLIYPGLFTIDVGSAGLTWCFANL